MFEFLHMVGPLFLPITAYSCSPIHDFRTHFKCHKSPLTKALYILFSSYFSKWSLYIHHLTLRGHNNFTLALFTVLKVAFPNSIFAREGAFHVRSSTVTCIELSVFPISCFIIICLSVCRFVEGNIWRKFAHCFV